MARYVGCVFCLGLVVIASAAADPVVLPGDGLDGWRGDTGDWLVVGEVSQDQEDPKKLAWEPGEGVLVNGPDGRTANLVTEEAFGDVRAHVEFMVPEGSNSGVYFMGRYEIQVLDSWGVEEPESSDCGGIYQRWDSNREPPRFEGHAPRVNASRPPGEWQVFEVVFRAPRFDADGNKTANAVFEKVVHNGELIHENAVVTGPTRASLYQDEQPKGPIMLQGTHGPVAYRNIRIERLDGGQE